MSHCLRDPPPALLLHPSRRRRPRRPHGRGHHASRPLVSLARFDQPPLLRLKVADSSDCPVPHAPLLPQPHALIGSLSPVWREGLFLVRCSVLAAVLSVAAALSWYAQLRARAFVEARLLPAACAMLGEYLQWEVHVGKVRSVTPLGITLHTCSIGPHAEEFSCAGVPVMKIRVRPFASLRRGRVVVDAVLSEPSALVAQKDYSWLGIPVPSEGTLKRHSGEEGIDYRTKTRRLARDKAAEQRNQERDKAAREAAERGYVIPSGQPISRSADEMLGGEGPVEIGKSTPPLCADEMHRKDHHIDTGIDSGSKHADLEKSFGVKSRIPGINFWSRMIPNPSRRRYRRKAHSKVVSEIDNSSQQRILRHSAYAAVAYFQNIDSGHLDESSPDPGKSPPDRGHTDVGCEEATSNDGPIGSSETAATDFGELPENNSHSSDYAGKGKSASAMLTSNAKDVFSEHSHNEQSSQCGSHDLDSIGLGCHHLDDLQHGQANFSQSHVLGKFHNLSEDNIGPQQEFIFGNFGSCTHAHNWASFWPFQLKGFPVSFNAPSALDVQIQ